MSRETRELDIIIYCDLPIELNDEFEFYASRNLYIKDNITHSENVVDWLKYSRIEIEFINEGNRGYYREYYKSGKLRRAFSFISLGENNEYYVDGKERLFYEGFDGEGNLTYTIISENEYHQGEKVGIRKSYSINGGLLKEEFIEEFKDSENGSFGMKVIEYHPSSNTVASINDKEFGKSYYEGGSLKAEWKNKNYINDGDYLEYHENGKIKMSVSYIDGERNGLMLKYYESGVIKEEWKYSMGKRIYVKKYYPNKIPKSEWQYANGQLISKKEFDKNGNLKLSK